MRVIIPLREALADPRILGGVLTGASWDGWKALLLACAGEKLTDDERAHFTRLTGRDREPGDGFYAKLSCALVVVVAVNPKPFRRSVLGWRPVATGLPT